MMDRSVFLKLLKQRLPGLRHAINQQRGNLLFEINELTKCAQCAIFDGDRERLEICFRLAELAYAEGDNTLRKLIDLSFVEPLDFVTPHNSYPWAWEMMPVSLKALYEAFHIRTKIPRSCWK